MLHDNAQLAYAGVKAPIADHPWLWVRCEA
jgi:hypothetical protein